MAVNQNVAPSAWCVALYELFNPVPVGCFVAAMICDVVYLNSVEIFWTQAASWLIVFGLFVAIIPRLMSLGQVWPGRTQRHPPAQRTHFWLNALAIILAIVNAFIHSRDAYAVVPMGIILSILTVLLLLAAHLQLALRQRRA